MARDTEGSGSRQSGVGVPATRHCKHCLGDCSGNCLLPGGSGLCIHKPVRRIPLRDWPNLLMTPGFWRRLPWGTRGRPHEGSAGRSL